MSGILCLVTVPVIQRKFALPALPAPHVSRGRLLERLAEGLAPRKRVTLVRGGPGSGKTALLAEYATAVPAIECWYGLGPGDSDPAVFFRHLVACLSRRLPDLPDRVEQALNALGKTDYQQAVALLCDDLSMVVDAPVVLVIDDAQYIPDQPEVLAALEALVRFFPDDSQLVFAGRKLPPLRLAREQAMGQVVAVEERDLAFSQAEIVALLVGERDAAPGAGVAAEAAAGAHRDRQPGSIEGGRLEFPAADRDIVSAPGTASAWSCAADIHRRTAGWVTGAAYLAAGRRAQGLAAAGHPARTASVADQDLLFDYLAQEVLDPLEAGFRDALLSSSFLPTLSVAACRPLFGDDAEAFVRRVGGLGSFVLPEGEGLTFQPVFREFLQQQFASRHSAPAREALFRTLAAASTDPLGAAEFWLTAGDFEAAESRILGAFDDLLRAGRRDSVARTVARMRELQPFPSAALLYMAGELARQGGKLGDAVALLEQASDVLGPDGDATLQGRIWAALAASHGAGGNLEEQEACGIRALETAAPEDLPTRAMALNALGLAAAARLDLEGAQERFDAALELYRRIGDRPGEIRILHNRGLAHAKGGDFERAVAAYGEAVRQAAAAAITPFPLTFNNLALCHLYLGRTEEAWQAFERGMALAEQVGTGRDRILLLRTLGQLHLQAGDGPRAREAFEASLAAAVEAGDRGGSALAHFGLAEEALARRDLPRARALLDHGVEASGLPLDSPAMIEAALLAVRIEFEAGAAGRAAELLDRIEAHLVSARNEYQRFVWAVSRYRVACARGQEEVAGATMERIRALVSRYGYPMPADLTSFAASEPAASEPAASESAPAPRPGGASSGASPGGPVGPIARSGNSPILEVRCLGPFEVSVEGVALGSREWRSANAKLVLTYLLLNPQGATKERLLDLLYPGGEPARSALAMVINRLRQALEPGAPRGKPSRFILFQDGRYVFTRGVRSRLDASEIRSLVAQAREPARSAEERRRLLESAVALYRGPFLEEFPDSPWCQIERENVRRVAIEAWEELFALLADADEWQEVERVAEACLAVDPAAQAAHRAKLIALAMQERFADAMRFEAAASALLRTDLGLEPDPETSDLAALIREGRFTVRAARDFLATRWS